MSETTGPTAGERVLAKIIMADGIASPTATEAARRILASGWLDVVRRKAGDERGERIAQAIDRRRFHVGDCVCVVCAAYRHAASVARAYVADRSESNVRDGCFAPPGVVRVGGVFGEDPAAGGDEGRAGVRGGVTLLPTPTASSDGNTPESHLARKPGRTQVTNLEVMARGGLLPTPRATDGTKGGPNQRGSSGDLMLPSAVARLLPTPDANADKYRIGGDSQQSNGIAAMARRGELSQWGDYAPAIHHWEQILGRPAPAPTMTSTKGNPQLAPRFVEWMMGLDEGHVDDVPNLTRNEKLKALGNGVVWQQAAEAVRRLLALGVAA